MLTKTKALLLSACAAVVFVILGVLLRKKDLAEKLKYNFELGRARAQFDEANTKQELAQQTYRDLAHTKGEIAERVRELETKAKEAEHGRVVDLASERDRRGWR